MRTPLAAVDAAAPLFWTGVLVGVLIAAAAMLALELGRRRAARARDQLAVVEERPVPATPVRRPIYLGRALLSDLLAHAEPRDFGRGLRASLADDDLEGNAGDTRMLNKVIAGLRRQRHLIDLDQDPDSPLAAGRALLVTARATEHPATALVTRAEQRVGARTGANGATNGNGNGAARADSRTRRRAQPLVLALTDERSGRTFVGVVDARRLRREDRAWMTSPVSVLAVVDDVLSSQDVVPAHDVLAPHTAQTLGDRRDELDVTGPGAIVSIAAIYR